MWRCADQQLSLVPSDKCGVFVAIDKTHLVGMMMSKLVPGTYQPVGPSVVKVADVAREHLVIVETLALDLDDLAIAPYCSKWWHSCENNLLSPFSYTIKSHKPAGKVNVGLLHSCGRNPLGGISHVIRKRLAAYNSKLPHLMFGTTQVTEILRPAELKTTSRLVKCDVENFFMEAERDILIDLVSQVDGLKVLASPLKSVPSSQYVVCTLFHCASMSRRVVPWVASFRMICATVPCSCCVNHTS